MMKAERGRYIRDILRLLGSMILLLLYIPALVAYISSGDRKKKVRSDINRIRSRISFKLPFWMSFLYFLHSDRYYRSLYYYRIGPARSAIISWLRPGDKYFILSKTMRMGSSCRLSHPYATVLNAESIGDFFSCIHLTTIGDKGGKRPVIGSHVSVGANVTIIGGVHVGDNVEIGAGSIVVDDVPDNCIVAGNPARVIRYITAKT